MEAMWKNTGRGKVILMQCRSGEALGDGVVFTG
ncbi:hypothetical protein E2C01_083284 [Portunus trituberculatus]|uniref:Uncharacterized protein n=1 Tax=Portunus trituberculatus TaxID=210409 RepID=A0A5B7J1K4_PORTR|nr:hypothetical protein [Portunus trituberculatus]